MIGRQFRGSLPLAAALALAACGAQGEEAAKDEDGAEIDVLAGSTPDPLGTPAQRAADAALANAAAEAEAEALAAYRRQTEPEERKQR